MLKCPHCGLINPAEAEWCDCGYDLTGQLRPPPRPASLDQRPGMRGHTRFWLWLIGFGMIGKLSHGSPLEEELARVPSWLGLTLLVASFFLLVWPGYRRRASFTLAFVAALFFLVVWPGPHRKG